MALSQPVLLPRDIAQASLIKRTERREEGYANDARVAPDLDAAVDGGAIADLCLTHAKQPGGTAQAVLDGDIQVGTGANDGDGRRLLEFSDTPLPGKALGARTLLGAERTREGGQVFDEREDDRTLESAALQDRHPQGDTPGDVHRDTGNFTVALASVHGPHVDSGPGNLYGCDDDGAGPHRVHVQVAVGAVFLELLGRNRILVRSAYESRTEVAGVMGVRHADRRGSSKLSQRGAHSHQHPCHVAQDGTRVVQ